MDDLTNSVHEFIVSLAGAIEMVKYIKIGIESHAGMPDLDTEIENPEAVAYIQRQGKEDSKRLYEYLKSCSPALARIRSLSAKGQVLGGSDSLYWRNPKVQELLNKVIQLDPEEIKEGIEEQNAKFLAFVKENYETIYK